MTLARFHGHAWRSGCLVFPLLFGAIGCKTPQAGPAREEAGAPREQPTTISCASDEDCRTWSSYCAEAPCVCRVFAKAGPGPACASTNTVTCFVDPCMNKAAACQGGRCVLVMAGDAGR